MLCVIPCDFPAPWPLGLKVPWPDTSVTSPVIQAETYNLHINEIPKEPQYIPYKEAFPTVWMQLLTHCVKVCGYEVKYEITQKWRHLREK